MTKLGNVVTLTTKIIQVIIIRIQHVLLEAIVHKKLTITIDEKIYIGLYRTVGEGKISQFIENLVKPHVLPQNLEMAYREMAMNEERESEATDWIEGVIGDVNHAER